MRNITTGKKRAAIGIGGHEDITAIDKSQHPIAIHDVVLILMHSGDTILDMMDCVKVYLGMI